MAAITIKNMDVTYNKGKSYVIKDMNLEIKDGEFCVFLGPRVGRGIHRRHDIRAIHQNDGHDVHAGRIELFQQILLFCGEFQRRRTPRGFVRAARFTDDDNRSRTRRVGIGNQRFVIADIGHVVRTRPLADGIVDGLALRLQACLGGNLPAA